MFFVVFLCLMFLCVLFCFFFSSRRRHTRCALGTGFRRVLFRSSQLIEVASSQIDPADQAQWPSLQGPHNAQNAAVAIAVARALGLGDAGIAAALKSYSSLPHRMERIAERNGVLYVNDSKATKIGKAAGRERGETEREYSVV